MAGRQDRCRCRAHRGIARRAAGVLESAPRQPRPSRRSKLRAACVGHAAGRDMGCVRNVSDAAGSISHCRLGRPSARQGHTRALATDGVHAGAWPSNGRVVARRTGIVPGCAVCCCLRALPAPPGCSSGARETQRWPICSMETWPPRTRVQSIRLSVLRTGSSSGGSPAGLGQSRGRFRRRAAQFRPQGLGVLPPSAGQFPAAGPSERPAISPYRGRLRPQRPPLSAGICAFHATVGGWCGAVPRIRGIHRIRFQPGQVPSARASSRPRVGARVPRAMQASLRQGRSW